MLSRTFDVNKINSVLKHPDIWPLIADEETDIESFDPPMVDNHYLYSAGIVYILHPDGDDFQIHANVTKESRQDAFKAGQEALKYGFETIGADRIVAKIPIKYGNVYGFTLKHGFEDEGVVDGEHILTMRADQWAL